MSVIGVGAVGLPEAIQRGKDESVRVVLGKAAAHVDDAAELFGIPGEMKSSAYAQRFTQARDALSEGARLVNLVRAVEPADARAGFDDALAAIAKWRELTVKSIDFAAANVGPRRTAPAADRDELRALATQVRDLAPPLEGPSAERALLDEAARLSESAAPAPASTQASVRRGAALLGAAKLGGAGIGGAGVLELAQAAARFL